MLDRLQMLEVFTAVAEAGSLAAAARRLRLSPPTVTRAIAALERRLGARLFNRTTRSLSLTEPGVRFLGDVRALLADLEEAERSVSGEGATPIGHLTVTASVTFGRTHVAAVLLDFLRAEPRVTASLVLLDRVVNLIEEGIDVAVRIGSLPDSTLIARRVGDVRRVLVASPAYLAERGVPQAPPDLRHHRIIAFSGLVRGREWRFERDGRSAAISLAPHVEVNDATVAINGAEQGFGITVALSYMVARAIAEGRLMLVLDQFAPPALPVQFVYPYGRSLAPKVRAFVDFAAPAIQQALKS